MLLKVTENRKISARNLNATRGCLSEKAVSNKAVRRVLRRHLFSSQVARWSYMGTVIERNDGNLSKYTY